MGKWKWKTKSILLSAGFFVAAAAVLGVSALPQSAQAQTDSRQDAFKSAAKEFGVPEKVLLAVSYNKSRWESHRGKPSASGGYGVMHLTSGEAPKTSGRGENAPPKSAGTTSAPQTLKKAADLLKVPEDSLKKDTVQNIRGGAALLASYAKEQNSGSTPQSLNDWYGAIAQYSSSTDASRAEAFADDVFATLQKGATRSTTDGQQLQLQGENVQPNKAKLGDLERLGKLFRSWGSQPGVECPIGLDCRFVPARYAQNNPADPGDYGNYDKANRPSDMKINTIVIHDTEGSYQDSIEWFQNPASYASAHYVLRSSDGQVTQMVKTKDVAWHAGNWYVNMHSIGVEHEGFWSEGSTWYTEEMYRASAKLVRHLAQKYNVPLDRQHIVGHDQYHAPTPATVAGMHTDPGPYWDWEHYMQLLQAPVMQTGTSQSKVVTIAPKFATNKLALTDCAAGTCVPLPVQSASAVFMRTAPNDSAPLVTDAGLHPDNSPGTNAITDTSARAQFGEQFVVAGRQGDWTAVWFNGQKAWFKNPQNWNTRTALPAKGKVITPKAGATSIPLYGRAYPEASAYPPAISAQAIVPLPYSIPAGQKYVSYEKPPTDYFHALLFGGGGAPNDDVIVVGNEKYYLVSYSHRQGYVKAGDVTVSYEW